MCNQYDIEINRGDTFNERELELVEYDDETIPHIETPVDLTGASILMQVRQSPGSTVLHEFSTANGKIEITNAIGGQFRIKEEIINIAAGLYQHDIQITFGDLTVRTYFKGIFKVNDDISRP